MTFGEQMKKARLEYGLTLAQVADEIGVTEATIHKYESGRLCNPKYEFILSVSRVLHIPLLSLMGWDTDAPDTDIAILRRNAQQGGISISARAQRYLQNLIDENTNGI